MQRNSFFQNKTFKLISISIIVFLSGSCEKTSDSFVFDKAKYFTVKILAKYEDGITKYGTGIIFKNSGNSYYVLTSKHTVFSSILLPPPDSATEQEKQQIKKINELNKDQSITIITMDRKEYQATDNSLQPIEDLDLAIFKFVSDEKYELAKFSEQILPQELVYLFGYKGCYDTKQKSDEFNYGKIISMNNIKFKTEQKPDEYDTYYTNAAIKGMSGSPLLNKNGEIVAIHGWAGKKKIRIEDSQLQVCDSLREPFQNNWGISVKKFIGYLQLK